MARILVIDDDQDGASTTKRILLSHGHDVEAFYDARSGIEDAKRRLPDLILMDLMMPKYSGEEAIKELKDTPDLAQIPVIILTGLLSPEEYLDMSRITIDGKVYKILGKPYKIDELLKAVKESLTSL
jgi:two-component system, OmpR family, alkaline phosphatase synthesis response regulator PhoP